MGRPTAKALRYGPCGDHKDHSHKAGV